MAVSVSTEREFLPGSPTEVFEHLGLRRATNYAVYDVSLDGQRFILPERVGVEETQTAEQTIRVVLSA
ncbi:MAG: hypothetical protein O7D29_09390 [Gemmatimonadetes bacterium]|nr:hypothetical protein [Planctomycetota bacterium]MCZ6760567.1 hypothetical protein [Gemmatimonadota bacterium]